MAETAVPVGATHPDPACNAEDAIFRAFKAALLSLDGSRVHNLLEEYRRRHGRAARESAFLTCRRWREGGPACWDAAASRLFDLLPHHLNEQEKLTLIQRLRAEALKRIKPAAVRLTLARPSDLAAVILRTAPAVRRLELLDLPIKSPVLREWLSDTNALPLARVAEETDRLLAARRLADLIVRLTLLYRLRTLAGAETHIHVTASLATPTATLLLQFRQSFWKENSMNETTEGDQDFLVRLQDLALAQEWQDGAMGYVDFVMRTLTPPEQEKLRSVAVAEGLRTEILLRELHVKTLAAKADIELTLETTQKLKDQRHHGRIISEHVTASGTTRIEVVVEPCPLLRPLTRWRKPKRLEL